MTEFTTQTQGLEIEIIATMIKNPETIGTVYEEMKLENFSDEKTRAMAQKLFALYEAGETLTRGVIYDVVQKPEDAGDPKAIEERYRKNIKFAIPPEEVRERCHRILKRRQEEQFKALTTSLIVSGSQKEVDWTAFKKILSEVRAFGENSFDFEPGAKKTGAIEATDAVVTEARDTLQGKQKIFRTGYKTLDVMLSGGYRPHELNFIGAGTGVGKTIAACDMTRAFLKQGLAVTYFHLEETAQDVTRRIMAAEGAINGRAIMDPALLTEAELSRFDFARSQLVKWNGRLSISTQENQKLDLKTICDEIRRQAARGVEVFIIDYIGLISIADIHSSATETDRLVKIVDALKDLCTDLPITIVALSQIKRAATEAGELSATSFSGSSRIETTASSAVIFDRNTSATDESEIPVVRVSVVKARRGTPGQFQMLSQIECQRFEQWQEHFQPSATEQIEPTQCLDYLGDYSAFIRSRLALKRGDKAVSEAEQLQNFVARGILDSSYGVIPTTSSESVQKLLSFEMTPLNEIAKQDLQNRAEASYDRSFIDKEAEEEARLKAIETKKQKAAQIRKEVKEELQ